MTGDAYYLSREHGGPWGEHRHYAVGDWMREVADPDGTHLGYWDWVLDRLIIDGDDRELQSDVRMEKGALALANLYGGVGKEYPGHSWEDWRAEVANEDTRAGYWEWVYGQLYADDPRDWKPGRPGMSGKKRKPWKVGVAAVDTGMLLIIDPAYLFSDEEWREEIGARAKELGNDYPKAILEVLAARTETPIEELGVVAEVKGDGGRQVTQDDDGVYIED